MPRVLVVGRVHADGLAILRRIPELELDHLEAPGPDEIAAAMTRADALLVRTQKITAAMIEGAAGLRVVSRHGVGTDSVDVAALTRRRIPLAVAATANMRAVAEHAFFMITELLKLGRAQDAAVRQGDWSARDRLVPLELAGKALLLVGLGRVGRQLARRASAFEMRTLAYDPYLTPAAIKATGCVPIAGLTAGLREADAVSLHLPLSPGTRGVIGQEQLRAMRPEAVLVNTARGGLVDEAALATALREGWIRGAGLDVFDDEPPPPDHPLLELHNMLLSPHLAGVTAEASVRMATESAANLVAALEGRLDPAVCVNPEVL